MNHDLGNVLFISTYNNMFTHMRSNINKVRMIMKTETFPVIPCGYINTPNHTDRPHARCSPSSSSRWLNCTASTEYIEKQQIVQKPNPFADEGTIAHEYAEQLFRRHPQHISHIKTMHEHISNYVEYCKSLGSLIGIEVSVPLFYSPKEHGTVDYIAISSNGKALHIVDLKYGQRHKVSAIGNSQIIIYAISAIGFCDIDTIEEVHLHIYQPRMNNISVQMHDMTSLETWKNHIIRKHNDITSGNTSFTPGETQCPFCPARGRCKAFAKWHGEQVSMDFDNLDEKLPDTNTPSLEQAAIWLKKTDKIVKWRDEIKDFTRERLEAGDTTQDLSLHPGKKNRTWSDPAAAENLLFDEIGGLSTRVVSPSKAFAMIGPDISLSLKLKLNQLIKTTEGETQVKVK